MSQDNSKLQALAAEILELTKTHEPSNKPGSENELAKKAQELVRAAQSPMDQAQASVVSLVEGSIIRTLLSLKALQSIPANGSAGLAQLQKVTGASASLLERLFRVVVGTGFIIQEADGSYSHSALSSAYAGMIGQFYSTVFDELTVLTSLPQYLKTHGLSDPDGEQAATHNPMSWHAGQEGKTAFEIMEQDPEKLQNFQLLMTFAERIRPFTGFYDFSKLADGVEDGRPVFVDVGGANGKMIAEVLKAHPTIKPEQCVNQDREQVIELAKQNPELPKGVQLQAHDFFQPQILKGAKAYHLRAITHDWSDAAVMKILQNIVLAMEPDSKVLIGDNVMPESGGHGFAACSDMMMMCMGGKERTEKNFRSVLDAAGLKLDEIHRSPGGGEFAIVEASLK